MKLRKRYKVFAFLNLIILITIVKVASVEIHVTLPPFLATTSTKMPDLA